MFAINCLLGTITPARSNFDANSKETAPLFSLAFLSIYQISSGNVANGSAVASPSRNFLSVLILFTVAPPRSLPGLVALTNNNKDVTAPDKFEIVKVGRGAVREANHSGNTG